MATRHRDRNVIFDVVDAVLERKGIFPDRPSRYEAAPLCQFEGERHNPPEAVWDGRVQNGVGIGNGVGTCSR